MTANFHTFTDETSPHYKLVYEEHPGYFFACVEAGVLTVEQLHEYKQKIADQISIRKYDRVMIKRDLPLTASAVELCAGIYKVHGWNVRLIRYAFVDVNPAHINAYRLGLLYARSFGMEAEVFGDIPTAEAWLLS